MDDSQVRLLNVSLLPGSGAHRAYYDRSGSSVSELTADALAAGFPGSSRGRARKPAPASPSPRHARDGVIPVPAQAGSVWSQHH
jgi:hypothetical protein